jgi:hypothetical protein
MHTSMGASVSISTSVQTVLVSSWLARVPYAPLASNIKHEHLVPCAPLASNIKHEHLVPYAPLANNIKHEHLVPCAPLASNIKYEGVGAVRTSG